MERTISGFFGEYRFLSNFYPCDITICGVPYKSTEAAYQAAKSPFISERKNFSNLNPKEAKSLGRRIQLHDRWDDVAKVQAMELCLRAKFAIPGLNARLRSTSPLELIESNSWGDEFWGVCHGKGRNVLGKILMILRDEAIQYYEPPPISIDGIDLNDNIPF